MKWIEARHLVSWAERIDARVSLSEVVSTLVRASAARFLHFDFPRVMVRRFPATTGGVRMLDTLPPEWP